MIIRDIIRCHLIPTNFEDAERSYDRRSAGCRRGPGRFDQVRYDRLFATDPTLRPLFQGDMVVGATNRLTAPAYRKFESSPLQRRVRCELSLGKDGFADEIAAAPSGSFATLDTTICRIADPTLVARPRQLRDASTVMRFRPAHQSMINRRHDGRASRLALQSLQQMLERKPRIYLPATCKGGHESGWTLTKDSHRFVDVRIYGDEKRY